MMLLLMFTNIVKDAKAGNDAIETAAWVFMTADSVARGGEVKFQVFKEWDYDHFLKVTNTCWTELKTCDFYAMARVPDVKWCFCFYFHMAAYFMCCNGLYPNEEQFVHGRIPFPAFYPRCHCCKENYCSNQKVSACVAQQREQGQIFFQVFVPGPYH